MNYLIKNIDSYDNNRLFSFLKHIRPNKRKRIQNYSNIKRKKQAILGEILLAELLKKYYHIDYKNCLIKENKNGKPYITNYNLYFNISHCNNIVICALSRNEIGVDIEKIRTINLNTISYFANKKEQEYIFSNSDQIYKRAFKIYTLKEAYLKLLGSSIINIKNINTFDIRNKNIKTKILEYHDYIISIITNK